ncbi:uncharacterized protein BDZ99DRAFT_464527 [Mytilinidion resinicola]|uniref:Uncharacterized protein n=1 Tax=Mytilinidion resinicola TaxID=574789 RepID=A0A6A6YFL0_9PEZI|nr:uncharacterized protein BDZ99DRAFT_464527 [Mytilinidion resinicola]KAF2807591.1 hypothetical protein BDZ99DRAFT_464527 [Mytilinidion resinicola]
MGDHSQTTAGDAIIDIPTSTDTIVHHHHPDHHPPPYHEDPLPDMANDAAVMAPLNRIYQQYGTILVESPRDRRRRSQEESPAWQCFSFTVGCAMTGFTIFVLYRLFEAPHPW